MKDYVTDPELLAQLNAPQGETTPVTSDTGYITDPALLAQLNTPSASETPKKPSLLERFKAKMNSPEAQAHPLRTAGEAIGETGAGIARGLWETPLALATGFGGMMLGGAAQAGTAAYDFGKEVLTGEKRTPGVAQAVGQQVEEASTYQPTGEVAQAIMKPAGEVMSGFGVLPKAAEYLREKERAETGGNTTGTDIVLGLASARPDLAIKGVGKILDPVKQAAIESAQRHQEAATNLESKNFIKDTTDNNARDAGYTIFGEGLKSRLASGLSGGAKLKQEYQINNQEVTTAQAKKALDIPDEIPLSSDVLSTVRKDAYNEGYAPLKQLGEVQTDSTYKTTLDGITKSATDAAKSFPDYKEVVGNKNAIDSLVDAFKQPTFDAEHAVTAISNLRESASGAFRKGDYDVANANRAIASALEDQIERHLEASGADGAAQLQTFRDSRQRIAQSHTVEDALVGSDVNANKILSEYKRNKGKFAEGPLLTIAKTAEQHPDVMRIPLSLNKLPVSAIDAGLEVGGLAGAAVGHGLMGGAAMALPFAKLGVRKILTSKMVQSRMGKDYSTPIADFIVGKARETASEMFDRIKAERMRQHEAESATEQPKQSSGDTYKTDGSNF